MLVLHRLVPPRASLRGRTGAAPRRALAELVREPRKQTHDGLEVTYVPYVSPPRSRSYASWGAWAAPALGLALRRLRRSFRVRPDPRPQRRARRRRRAPRAPVRALRRAAGRLGARRRRALHGRRPPTGSARAPRRWRAGWAPRGWCSPTARASPSWRAPTAPARRAWCTSAPTCPRPQHPSPIATGGLGSPRDSGHGRAPGRAQAPRRRAARAGGALPAPSDAALRDRRRRPRAGRARRARRASGGRRAGRVPRPAGARGRRSSRRGAARCS